MRAFSIIAAIASIVSFTSVSIAGGLKVAEHAVVVHFNYGIMASDGTPDLGPLRALEQRLDNAINSAKVGEYDGDEIAVSGKDGFLYMYGPDADRLFETIRPILEETPFMKGASVKKRYGAAEAGVKESVVRIAP